MKPIMVVTGTESFAEKQHHHCIWQRGLAVCYEVKRIYGRRRVIIMVYMHGTHSKGKRDTMGRELEKRPLCLGAPA